MVQSEIALLGSIVARYDDHEQPVRPADFASTAAEGHAVRNCFESFHSKHLLKRVDGGYRPTVTARELLELDIADDALLVFDCDSRE